MCIRDRGEGQGHRAHVVGLPRIPETGRSGSRCRGSRAGKGREQIKKRRRGRPQIVDGPCVLSSFFFQQQEPERDLSLQLRQGGKTFCTAARRFPVVRRHGEQGFQLVLRHRDAARHLPLSNGPEACVGDLLRPGGRMIYVVPGAEHLYQMKAVLYEKPYNCLLYTSRCV